MRISRCSKLIAIKLCAISEMHAKVRRGSVAGYATDDRLILNSYLIAYKQPYIFSVISLITITMRHSWSCQCLTERHLNEFE